MKKILTVLLAAFAIMSCGNNPKQAQSPKGKPWQEIAPTEIELNPVQMIDKDWMEVSAGKEGNMNLMTISWGTIGELWGKPVFTVFVSTSRYTHKFMEEKTTSRLHISLPICASSCPIWAESPDATKTRSPVPDSP